MNKLLIIGAGGHGKVVAEAAIASGVWQSVCFLDDRYDELKQVLCYSVIGEFKKAEILSKEFPYALVAIGDNSQRLIWIDKLVDFGFKIPVVVHPSACVSSSAVLLQGSVIMAGAMVQAESRIGRGCIINTGATIDHDCKLSDGVHACPGVNIAGGVHIGKQSFLGIGSSVIPGIKIGAYVLMGAGSVIIKDVEDSKTLMGVPAKEVDCDKVVV